LRLWRGRPLRYGKAMRYLVSVLLTLAAAGVMALVLRRFYRRLRQIEEELWGPPKPRQP